MKHMKLFTGIGLTLALLFSGGALKAQTNWHIEPNAGYLTMSNNTPCALPSELFYSFYASGLGYTTNDSCTVFADFGDGQQTVARQRLNWINTPWIGVVAQVQHSYAVAGIYTLTVAVTDDFGNSDTAVFTNAINATTGCESSVHLYVDNNTNCVYDAGDTPLNVANVVYKSQNGFNQYGSFDSNSGAFRIGTVTGETYEVSPSTYYFPNLADYFSCSATDTIQFTAASSNSLNFPVLPGKHVSHGAVIGDSLGVHCSLPAASYQYGALYGMGFNNGDSLFVHAFFGDGQDTILPVVLSSLPQPFSNGWFGLLHTYQFTGNYQPVYVIYDNFGFTDTIYPRTIIVNDSCGNIAGHVYQDLDASCTFSPGEGMMGNRFVSLYQNNQLIAMDPIGLNGSYAFQVMPGNYEVKVGNIWPYVMACSASDSVSVTVSQQQTTYHDFGLECPASSASMDLAGYLSGTLFRPGGQIAYLYPGVYAQSCTNFQGTVTVLLDPLTTYAGSCDTSFHPQVNGNTVSWNFTGSAQQNYFSWGNCLQLTTSNNAQIGDTVCFTLIVSPSVPDQNSHNDTVHVCYPVRNSWDPNMKEASSPDGIGSNGEIQQNTSLAYTIHFQNTGTDVAYNIAITDTLDSGLDLATLQILGSSHNMLADMPSLGVLRFSFPNINLPDSASDELHSHGWVNYRINTIPNQPLGTSIHNTAYIYFDINPAVITNTTIHTISVSAGIDETSINAFQLYPVPVNDLLRVSFSQSFEGNIVVLDLSGRVLKTVVANGSTAELDMQHFPAGTYLVRCSDGIHAPSSRLFTVQH